MICPLCQFRFEESSACGHCGWVKNCSMVKCPHCGYEFVERSHLLDFFRRLFKRFSKEKKNERPDKMRSEPGTPP